MNAKEHLFDLSTREKREEATGHIANILYEIYLIEEKILEQQLIQGYLEPGNNYDEQYIMDELIDMIPILVFLYD